MSLYMLRAQYTAEAMKSMLARPGDREGPAREVFESAGMKLQHIWFSSKGEIVCVAEGDAVQSATVGMVVSASGLCNPSIEELLTTKQQLEAMKRGGEVAAKYRAPGK